MRRATAVPLALVLTATLLAAACAGLFATKIGTIQADPRKYDGQSVTIKGTVTASANLLIVKGYWVQDDTGKLLVITEGAVPSEGQAVTVTGTVTQAFSIGSSSALVLKEDARRH
jgi:hypothetical protein